MTATPEEIRALVEPFMRALEKPLEFSEEALFEGREALKGVFDCIDQRSNPALADGFGGIQAMLQALIRKGTVEHKVALRAMGSLLEALLVGMENKPASDPNFAVSPPGQTAAPAASQYLRLTPNGGPAIPLQVPGESRGLPLSGPSPSPKDEHSLGQLLVHSGKISQGQLSRALDLQQINGRRLGDVLIAMEAIGIHSLEEALSRQQVLSQCKPTEPDGKDGPPSLRLES